MIKNFKLNYLQDKYKEISSIISNLTKHIIYLEDIYFIDSDKKNQIMSILYEINKNLNTSNNNYLKNQLKEPTNIDYEINLLVNDKNYIYTKQFYKLMHNKYLPFCKETDDLQKLILDYGYTSIIELLNILNENVSLKELKELNEINDVFIPLSINYFNVDLNSNQNYYWRKPKKFNKYDILELTRELWIHKENLTFIKIEGIFKYDAISTCYKTCQINYPLLYKNKKNIENSLSDISDEFIKKFLKYDYLGNLYSLSVSEYTNWITESYKLYNNLIKLPFMNIMKRFLSNNTDTIKLYNIIFLLLLNEENNNGASLLLGLLKEKKNNAIHIYNIILKNLPFFLQLKIKKSNNELNDEIDKIKTISFDDLDPKKQLISNNFINNYAKKLTLEKIEEMKTQSNEYYKQKIFVEHIIKFPWGSNNDDIFQNITKNKQNTIDFFENTRKKLNQFTYGHNEAKDTILQTIANWITNPNASGKPLGFVGPPGVGKTLLAKSISKVLDIPFSEITLGGQNDGELLHGHGFTYSGSQPGIIIKKMVEMGKERCIIYFDELDKTVSKHGTINEITSILIHLTDVNMNKSFQDRFFQGIDFPLDKVIMIFSYNDPDKVDPILLDRLTQIKVKAYTLNEKIIIIRDYVIPELKKSIGINDEILWTNLSDELIVYIIENYTNEAGIRDIKRKIEKIFLTINLEILTNKININNYILNIDEIKRILLNPEYEITKIHTLPKIGIINGLYATTNGDGGIIPIQIFNNFTGNNFEIKLTGKQGEIMKESVQCSLTCALDYIKRNLNKYNIIDLQQYLNENFKTGFHVHCPNTATPKDGPSAGCAFTSCFISRILNIPIKNNIAMTGEIELTGRITKIGGLNYKLIGAKKAGVNLVYIPYENKNDFDEIINKNSTLIDNNFKVQLIEYIDDFIDMILIK
jgi:endopeptidase La